MAGAYILGGEKVELLWYLGGGKNRGATCPRLSGVVLDWNWKRDTEGKSNEKKKKTLGASSSSTSRYDIS